MDNQNLGDATTVVEPSSGPSKRNILIGIGAFVLLVLISGVSYIYGVRTERTKAAAMVIPTLIPTQVPVVLTATPVATEEAFVTPTTDPTTVNWETYTDAYYTFRHPKVWVVTAKDDGSLGHQVTIANATQTVLIRVMSGKQIYSLGSDADISSNEIAVVFNSKTYNTREQIVGDRDVFVDFKMASTNNNEYQILFGSGYPPGDGTKASKADYNANRETVLKILATFRVIK